MTFRANNLIPQIGYNQARKDVLKLKAWCINMSTQLDATQPAQTLIDILYSLSLHKAVLNNIKGIPGLAEYARAQENDPTYDPVAEFLNIISLINAAGLLIQSNNVNILINSWTNTGIEWSTFTPTQLLPLKAAIEDIANSIS